MVRIPAISLQGTFGNCFRISDVGQVRREIWRWADYPSRDHRHGLPLEREVDGDGAIGDIVEPAVVVGVAGDRARPGHASGLAFAAEHQKPTVAVGCEGPSVSIRGFETTCPACAL